VKRILMVLTVAVVMAAMMVATALPAFAQGRPEEAGPPEFAKGPPEGVPGGAFKGADKRCENAQHEFDLTPEPPPEA
jgi:hypothetical protein